MKINPKIADGEPVCNRDCEFLSSGSHICTYNHSRNCLPEFNTPCVPGLCQQREEARILVFDAFNQACQVSFDNGVPEFDHMCSGTLEEIQETLIEWGMIKKEQCRR